jgi:hypothetical protein
MSDVVSSDWMTGSKYDGVFPDPVGAQAIKSRFFFSIEND